MRGRLTARRLLALALLLVPVGLLGLGVWWPIARIEAQKAELAALEARIERLEARLSTREQLLAEIRLLERRGDAGAMLLEAAAPALAGAELQGLVSDIVEGLGGAINSIEILEPESTPPFERIAVRAEFAASMTALRAILHDIETGEPVMTIDRIAMRSLDGQAGMQDLVLARFEVSAFARPAEPAAESGEEADGGG